MKRSKNDRNRNLVLLPLHKELEQAIQKYWHVQQLWHSRIESKMTTSQAIKTLSRMVENYRLPPRFKKQVAVLRQEIIYNSRPKKYRGRKSDPVRTVIPFRK